MEFKSIRALRTRILPPKELTGADVSRMLKHIEKDLEHEADRNGKPYVEVDEVRLYRNGKDTGLRTPVVLSRMYPGDSLNLNVHFDIT